MFAGFRASPIGQYGIQDFSWWQGPGGFTASPTAWAAPGAGTESPFFSGVPVLDALGSIILPYIQGALNLPGASVPSVRTTLPGGEAPIFVEPDSGGPILVPRGPSGAEVINPDYRPSTTVYENAPGGVYEVERAPTDWDAYYRRYVELNKEEEPMFDFWTGAVDTGIGWGNQLGLWGGGAPPAIPPGTSVAVPGGAPMPARVTVDTRTGKVTACKRRRRRKLLTESDFNVLLRVATLPNKESVRIVLGKAIGRS